jgi:hypothetical protein
MIRAYYAQNGSMFNSTIAGKILMKFITDNVPLKTIKVWLFSILYNQKYQNDKLTNLSGGSDTSTI